MMKPLIGLLAMVCILSACQKDVYDSNYNPNLGVSVPDGFEWSTTKSLTVNVDVNDEYNGKYYYAVRVYDKMPTEGILPVAASGKVNKDMPFSQKIVVPATVSKLYIHQVFKKADASEVIVKKEVAVDGEAIACSFGNSSKARSASTRADGAIIEAGETLTINSIKEIPDKVTVRDGGTLDFKVGGELSQKEIHIDYGGKMTAAIGTTLSLKNSEIYNYGEVRIYDIEFNNGSTLYNGDAMEGKDEGACFYANEIYMNQGHGSDKRYLGERSYTYCEKLILNNVKLTLKTGAWLNCGTLEREKTNGQGANTLSGDGDKIAGTQYTGLATIGKIEGNLTIESNVLVECSDVEGNIVGKTVDNASGMITITGTACSDGGFGNTEKAELGTYTYIVEDMYPSEGDYDMNDIVVTLTAEYDDDDELEIEGHLKAVGAMRKIYLYIRVGDEIKPLFEKDGVEIDAHTALTGGEVAAEPINTIAGVNKFEPAEFDLEFDDVKKILNMDDIDFFIKVEGKEIHWNTMRDNTTWGMRIPGDDFEWPQEKVRISDAYPGFEDWFKSPSADWYMLGKGRSGAVYKN